MSGITVVSENPSLEQSLITLYGRDLAIRRVFSSQWRDPAETAMDICAADPDLVVIGSDLELDDVKSIIPEIDRRFPRSEILALTQTRSPEVAIDLMRLGARDVIIEEPASEEFKAHIDRVIDVSRERRQQQVDTSHSPRRRVICVLSPKGGTGKTTIATNLAVGLARRRPNQALLIDMDLQFGDCAPALGLKFEHDLTHAIASQGHDRSALKVFLTPHRSGLSVLPPPEDLAVAEEIETDSLKRTLGALTEEFPFVVIDTAAGIDPHAVTAMEFATDFLFVSTPDIPSIRALSRQIEALDQIGFNSQRRSFIVNRANSRTGLSTADVEASVGMEATFEVPSNRNITISTNEGEPMIEKESGSLVRVFDQIADSFAPKSESAGRSRLALFRKDR